MFYKIITKNSFVYKNHVSLNRPYATSGMLCEYFQSFSNTIPVKHAGSGSHPTQKECIRSIKFVVGREKVQLLNVFHFAQLSMLEEEFVGRRSFWRRQRHRERELSEQQTILTKQILDNYDVTLNHVSEQMELINEGK